MSCEKAEDTNKAHDVVAEFDHEVNQPDEFPDPFQAMNLPQRNLDDIRSDPSKYSVFATLMFNVVVLGATNYAAINLPPLTYIFPAAVIASGLVPLFGEYFDNFKAAYIAFVVAAVIAGVMVTLLSFSIVFLMIITFIGGFAVGNLLVMSFIKLTLQFHKSLSVVVGMMMAGLFFGLSIRLGGVSFLGEGDFELLAVVRGFIIGPPVFLVPGAIIFYYITPDEDMGLLSWPLECNTKSVAAGLGFLGASLTASASIFLNYFFLFDVFEPQVPSSIIFIGLTGGVVGALISGAVAMHVKVEIISMFSSIASLALVFPIRTITTSDQDLATGLIFGQCFAAAATLVTFATMMLKSHWSNVRSKSSAAFIVICLGLGRLATFLVIDFALQSALLSSWHFVMVPGAVICFVCSIISLVA